jgi:hypothetical protein
MRHDPSRHSSHSPSATAIHASQRSNACAHTGSTGSDWHSRHSRSAWAPRHRRSTHAHSAHEPLSCVLLNHIRLGRICVS